MAVKRKMEMQDAQENIFADLGRPEAQDHYVKAQLIFQMQQIMKARQLTQTAVSKLLGIKQPDVSNSNRVSHRLWR